MLYFVLLAQSFKSKNQNKSFDLMNLPMTRNSLLWLNRPALFTASQANVPESSGLAFLTVNILPLTDRYSPSFSHFTVGVGRPDVGHVITTLAPANKVSSSPIFASTTSRFSSEVIFRFEYLILGGSGAMAKKKKKCKIL